MFHHEKPPPLSTALGVFTVLPLEIRDQIYFFILRPDCTFRWGPNACRKPHVHREKEAFRTSIVRLSSIFYNETVCLLQTIDVAIRLPLGTVQLLPTSEKIINPCPSPTSSWCDFRRSCSGTPVYAELQFRMFRKLTLMIDLPPLSELEFPEYRTLRCKGAQFGITRPLEELKVVLRNRPAPREVRLFINRPVETVDMTEANAELQLEHDHRLGIAPLLLDIIETIWDQGGSISIGRPYIYRDYYRRSADFPHPDPSVFTHDQDLLIPNLLQSAIVNSVYVTRLPDPVPRTVAMDHAIDKYQQEFCWQNTLPPTQEELLPYGAGRRPELVYGVTREEMVSVRVLEGRREMVPECLSCYEIFANFKDLERHLDRYAGHRHSEISRQPLPFV